MFSLFVVCDSILLWYALFGSKNSDASSASSSSKLKYYNYLIVVSGLYGATFN